MNGEALIAAFRQRADDTALPPFYAEADVFRWASEAEAEACIRGKLLYDTTSSFLSIAVVAAQGVYALDSRIDRIDKISFTPTGGRAFDLRTVGIDWIHDQCDWATRTGRPEVAAYTNGRLTVWPTPSTTGTGTLNLSAFRFPLNTIDSNSDEPEIAREHHAALVDWMLFLAYTTKDGETEDSPRAAKHEALFTEKFGERPDADMLRRHREKRRVVTRYGGY